MNSSKKQKNSNTKKELVKQLRTDNSQGLAGKGEVLQSVTKESVVYIEALFIMSDKRLDLEDEVGTKDIERRDLYQVCSPKLDKNVSDEVKFKQLYVPPPKK